MPVDQNHTIKLIENPLFLKTTVIWCPYINKYQYISTDINTNQQLCSNISKSECISTDINKYQYITTNINPRTGHLKVLNFAPRTTEGLPELSSKW
jgi:hypothetical protein